MPTFKVRVYGAYDKEAEKTISEIVTIEADRMEVFRSGALGLMRGHDHNGSLSKGSGDHLLHVFADTQWEEAWEEAQS